MTETMNAPQETKRSRGRPATGRRRHHKMQGCFDDAEVGALTEALVRAHKSQDGLGVPEAKRISPSLLVSLLAVAAAEDPALVERVAEQHAVEMLALVERVRERRGGT